MSIQPNIIELANMAHDMPDQRLQMAAKMPNDIIPPWLATTILSQRNTERQQAAVAMQPPAGGMPTIADQVMGQAQERMNTSQAAAQPPMNLPPEMLAAIQQMVASGGTRGMASAGAVEAELGLTPRMRSLYGDQTWKEPAKKILGPVPAMEGMETPAPGPVEDPSAALVREIMSRPEPGLWDTIQAKLKDWTAPHYGFRPPTSPTPEAAPAPSPAAKSTQRSPAHLTPKGQYADSSNPVVTAVQSDAAFNNMQSALGKIQPESMETRIDRIRNLLNQDVDYSDVARQISENEKEMLDEKKSGVPMALASMLAGIAGSYGQPFQVGGSRYTTGLGPALAAGLAQGLQSYQRSNSAVRESRSDMLNAMNNLQEMRSRLASSAVNLANTQAQQDIMAQHYTNQDALEEQKRRNEEERNRLYGIQLELQGRNQSGGGGGGGGGSNAKMYNGVPTPMVNEAVRALKSAPAGSPAYQAAVTILSRAGVSSEGGSDAAPMGKNDIHFDQLGI